MPPADLSRDPATLLREVLAAQARVERVRGTARVRISSPSLSGTVTEFATAEKPARVRLETLDFFGNPAAVLGVAEGRFAFWDARANAFYRGDATPENVSRLLPVVMPVEELVIILCGSAPVLPGTPLDVIASRDLLLLTIGLGDIGQRVAVGELATVEWSRVRRSAPLGTDQQPAYDLAFDDFHRRAGTLFPSKVRLDAPAGKSRVELAWRTDVDVNGRIDQGVFRIEPPRGARIIELSRGEAMPRAVLFPSQGNVPPGAHVLRRRDRAPIPIAVRVSTRDGAFAPGAVRP